MNIIRERHRFVVKESADSEPYVTIEPLKGKERALNLYLTAGSTIHAAEALARYLNDNVAALGFQRGD